MPDIASTLEHEFADASQTARASKIAELEKIDDNGRGSVDIVPQAIILPILAGIFGIMLIQYWLPNPYASIKGITAFSFGVVCVAYGAWALLYPHKPRFTLTEEGVRVKGTLLPWSTVSDYGVTEHRYNGLTATTVVALRHIDGYTPPKLNLSRMFGRTLPGKTRLWPQPTTVLKLYVGAKSMNGDKLSQRIGEFLAASRARAELARLRGE